MRIKKFRIEINKYYKNGVIAIGTRKKHITIPFPLRFAKYKQDGDTVITIRIFGKKILDHFNFNEFISKLKGRPPIYAVIWSRDCDMCEGTYFNVFHSRKNFEAYKNSAYEWAEGPMTITEVSKDQWELEREAYHGPRDRIMEAYENGRGWSIYV